MTHVEDAMRYAMEPIYEKLATAADVSIINQYTTSPRISSADLLKQINEAGRGSGGARNFDFYARQDVEAFRPVGEKIKVEKTMNQETITDFDEITWKIEVPGIPREDIEVFQVKNDVYVQLKGGKRIQKRLEADEVVSETKLDLGVLTVKIERPDKKVQIEIK